MTAILTDSPAADASANRGASKVATASVEMEGLARLVQSYSGSAPLAGVTILGCVTVTCQTAVYISALRMLGAELTWCSDNQFASDPDVLAFLNESGLTVFAEPHMSLTRYYECMDLAATGASRGQRIQIHDDGCDITRYLVRTHPDFLLRISGLTE